MSVLYVPAESEMAQVLAAGQQELAAGPYPGGSWSLTKRDLTFTAPDYEVTVSIDMVAAFIARHLPAVVEDANRPRRHE